MEGAVVVVNKEQQVGNSKQAAVGRKNKSRGNMHQRVCRSNGKCERDQGEEQSTGKSLWEVVSKKIIIS